MRVITGSARGMKLKSLEGLETRPTSDRVKEGIFNIIQFDVPGRRVLDLFGGSGQLAIEAISRNAKSAVIVENNPAAAKIIAENLKKTKMTDQVRVLQMDAARYLSSAREQFDLIFLDPPYSGNLLEKTLAAISEIDILSEGGIIVCERSRSTTLPVRFGNLVASRDYNYGKTAVSLYTREKTE